jgi:hypothetical protein
MYKILHLFSTVPNLKKCGKILPISLNRHTIWKDFVYLPKLGCSGETFHISTLSRVLYGKFQSNNSSAAEGVATGSELLIVCVDVDYCSRGAVAAGVWFRGWSAAEAVCQAVCPVDEVAEYEPGAFYRRELPCLLSVLALGPRPDVVVVDGYVWLGAGVPGLGGHTCTQPSAEWWSAWPRPGLRRPTQSWCTAGVAGHRCS